MSRKIEKEIYLDAISGCIFGVAVGDAFHLENTIEDVDCIISSLKGE